MLMALLELEAEVGTTQASRMEQGIPRPLGLPTLNERVEMYLHAVYGSDRNFTAEERAKARDHVLTKMATDIADQVSRPAESAVPPVSAPRIAAASAQRTTSSPRTSSGMLAEIARKLSQAIVFPIEALSMPRVRMAAIPLVALLAVVTVWGGISINLDPQQTTENPPLSLPKDDAPAVERRTTRSLAPNQSENATGLRSGTPAFDARKNEDTLKQEISSAERALGPNHPDVAGRLVLLANLYQSESRFAEAEALYNRALVIREDAFGPSDAQVAQTLNQLADLYRAQGRTREAEMVSRRAATIRQEPQAR
jgi:hypothetical protein